MFVHRTSVSSIALLVVAACLLAVPAAAQLTTGTVAGTIKDAQGGVIPGATVTLTSEARGTQLPPAFTNAHGDFVVRQRPARHLHPPGHDGGVQDAQAQRHRGQRRRPRRRSAR